MKLHTKIEPKTLSKDLINDLEAKNQQLHEEKKLKKKRKTELAKNLKTEESKVEKFSEMPKKCEEQEAELNEKIETAQNQEKAYQAELEKARVSFLPFLNIKS